MDKVLCKCCIDNECECEGQSLINAATDSYTLEQVSNAINAACNDITMEATLPDTGTVDALNLLVNAATCYLTGSAGTLEDVVTQNYEASLEEVIGWIED